MNFETSNVIFILLFIFPGAFSQILNNRFSPKSNKIHKNSIIEFSEILATSMIIMIINFIIIYLKTGFMIDSVKLFTELLMVNKFLIKYVVLTTIVTCLFTFIFNYINKIIINYMINKFNKKMNKPTESNSSTIWESIFEHYEFIDLYNNPPVISIEKDGVLLTRGFLRKWTGPNVDCNELVVNHSVEIEAYFESDKNKPDNEKIFYKIVMEYCFFETGTVIKFYDMTKYNDYVNSLNIE